MIPFGEGITYMMSKNIPQKTRHKNTGTKQLISIVISRYLAAPAIEQNSIVEFFNWAIRNSYDHQLQNFYIEVKRKVLEVAK